MFFWFLRLAFHRVIAYLYRVNCLILIYYIMKVHILCLLLCCFFGTRAQVRLSGYHQEQVDPALLSQRWEAKWISVPGVAAHSYAVVHFRKAIELDSKPEHYFVHVTADNRYKLFVNGQFASLGPARCDLRNWNFETVDIAPFLHSGKNVLAAVVWNFADKKPVAQISMGDLSFLMQGATEQEKAVNTNSSWLCFQNKAYSPIEYPVKGYYAAGAGELFDSANYPWGWEKASFDDSDWTKAENGINGGGKLARDYPGRLLVPTPIPPMEYKTERLQSVRRSTGVTCPEAFLQGKKAITVPAHTKVQLLLDHQHLTTGYLSLSYSQGAKAEIEIRYAEGLYNKEGDQAKGDRNKVDGKEFIGYGDKIIASGQQDCVYTPLWWRTWRYVQLNIETQDEPLVLNDIYGTFSGYPFVRESEFQAKGHEELNRMLDIGWQTARLCANETYMDCPYYEQLQYFGDTRIQAMITLYNTHDQYMVKNALEQGRQSMIADGITMSRYPSYVNQLISSFSLWWIGMGHDYWMYRGDEEYMKTLLPAHRSILSWYEKWLKPDYSLDYIPYWFFVDWSEGLDNGEPIREKKGNSALQDLMFLMMLDKGAEMEKAFGMPSIADHYLQVATAIRKGFKQKYWDATRGLFADTFDHHSYSQHVNSLAILTGMVEGDEAMEVMRKTLTEKDLTQATIYFRYYVHQALSVAGLGNELMDNLQIWRDQMALGLTTWAEKPEPSRSDCHAWGASPNIELYRILLGIRSDAAGFEKVRIAPALGDLKEVAGKMPHPKGFISVSYIVEKNGTLTAHIELPKGISGVFCWKGKEYALHDGEQTIII